MEKLSFSSFCATYNNGQTFWFSGWQIQPLYGLFDTTTSWPLTVNTQKSNAYKNSSQKILRYVAKPGQKLNTSVIRMSRSEVSVRASQCLQQHFSGLLWDWCASVCEECVMSRQCAVVRTLFSGLCLGRVRPERIVVKCVRAQSKHMSLSAGGGLVFVIVCMSVSVL